MHNNKIKINIILEKLNHILKIINLILDFETSINFSKLIYFLST